MLVAVDVGNRGPHTLRKLCYERSGQIEIWTQVFTRHVARLEIVTGWWTSQVSSTDDLVVCACVEVAG